MELRIGICTQCGYISVNKLESYCPNCGIKLVHECPACRSMIEHPLACFCPVCGREYAPVKADDSDA